jgi:hypothetical protein
MQSPAKFLRANKELVGLVGGGTMFAAAMLYLSTGSTTFAALLLGAVSLLTLIAFLLATSAPQRGDKPAD